MHNIEREREVVFIYFILFFDIIKKKKIMKSNPEIPWVRGNEKPV